MGVPISGFLPGGIRPPFPLPRFENRRSRLPRRRLRQLLPARFAKINTTDAASKGTGTPPARAAERKR